MAQYVVTDTELESVADAIRAKGGTVATLEFPSEFISAIEAINTGNQINVDISVSGGYNGGAVITIDFDGVTVFTATGNSPYNLQYNKTSDTISTQYGNVDILITPPATNTSDLVITITGEDTITKPVHYQGNNTSYGYSYTGTGVLRFSGE